MFNKMLIGATMLCVSGFSSAAVITQDFTVDRQLTNFTEMLTFNLFDDQGGMRELLSVEFDLMARSSGLAEVENRDSTPTSITATLSADIMLIDLDSAIILEATPFLTRTAELAAFDGVIDFVGPSGAQFLDLQTSDSSSITLSSPAALMDYVGVGTSSIAFRAEATSLVEGGGNIASGITTFASGDIRIVYNYREVNMVSAPAHLAIIGLGIVGFASMRRLKR
jgi:hypothetical protein